MFLFQLEVGYLKTRLEATTQPLCGGILLEKGAGGQGGGDIFQKNVTDCVTTVEISKRSSFPLGDKAKRCAVEQKSEARLFLSRPLPPSPSSPEITHTTHCQFPAVCVCVCLCIDHRMSADLWGGEGQRLQHTGK